MGIKIIPRQNEERHNADYDWLKTFHTFSLSSAHAQFGSVQVINEDRVAPRTGFGTHPHREFEIFSYIVSGQLEHKDSMGNVEVLRRGDLQLTSAGTGIFHSEKAHGSNEVHFLQIWSTPSVSRLQPRYFTRHFTDAEKCDVWARVVAPVGAIGVLSESREGKGPAPVQSPLTLYATLLLDGKSLSQTMAGSKGYIHVVQTSGYNTGIARGAAIKVFGDDVERELKEGDGAYIYLEGEGAHELRIENVGVVTAEVLLFDIE